MGFRVWERDVSLARKSLETVRMVEKREESVRVESEMKVGGITGEEGVDEAETLSFIEGWLRWS